MDRGERFDHLADRHRAVQNASAWDFARPTHLAGNAHDPVFLSAASLVELQSAIAKLSRGQAQRAEGLRHWLEALVSGFAGPNHHPIDVEIAVRAGSLMPPPPRSATPRIDFMTRCWLPPRRCIATVC